MLKDDGFHARALAPQARSVRSIFILRTRLMPVKHLCSDAAVTPTIPQPSWSYFALLFFLKRFMQFDMALQAKCHIEGNLCVRLRVLGCVLARGFKEVPCASVARLAEAKLYASARRAGRDFASARREPCDPVVTIYSVADSAARPLLADMCAVHGKYVAALEDVGSTEPVRAGAYGDLWPWMRKDWT
eukprot:4594727-Pleurochrysis_carterae.AAC.3